MKLNYDCIRDVLLVCEDQITMDDNGMIHPIDIDDIYSKCNTYSLAEIKYTIKHLESSDLIEAYIISSDTIDVVDATIYDLTFNGHKYISNIKDEDIWKTTKGIISKFANVSLEIVEKVSAQVITNLISQQLGM